MGFMSTAKSIPGLTHYYPLNKEWETRDAVGNHDGINHGAIFGDNGMTLNGSSYVSIESHPDFSVRTKGGLTIFVGQTIAAWAGRGGDREYIYWMGKGSRHAHEWSFHHHVVPWHTSFYHEHDSGGKAGCHFEDDDGARLERSVAGTCSMSGISIWKNGLQRGSEALSGRFVKPQITQEPVNVGTMGDNTGFMVGRVRRLAFYSRVLSSTEIATLHGAMSLDEEDDVEPTPSPPTDPYTIPAGTDLANTQAKINALVTVLKLKGILS